MTEPNIHFEHEGLVIDVDDSEGSATLTWKGISDTLDPSSHLTPFFAGLLSRLSGKSVILDFRELEYMNSAMVSPLIHLVKSLDAGGSRSTLLFDVAVPWQKANAYCMRAIARTLKQVEVP